MAGNLIADASSDAASPPKKKNSTKQKKAAFMKKSQAFGKSNMPIDEFKLIIHACLLVYATENLK